MSTPVSQHHSSGSSDTAKPTYRFSVGTAGLIAENSIHTADKFFCLGEVLSALSSFGRRRCGWCASSVVSPGFKGNTCAFLCRTQQPSQLAKMFVPPKRHKARSCRFSHCTLAALQSLRPVAAKRLPSWSHGWRDRRTRKGKIDESISIRTKTLKRKLYIPR